MASNVTTKAIPIIYRCPHYIIINKPPGVQSQLPDYRTHNKETIWDHLQPGQGQGQEYKTVQRLDTNVTGGMVIAIGKNSAKQFQNNLAAKETTSNKGYVLKRRYMALVTTSPMLLSSNRFGVFDQSLDGKSCKTYYKKIDLSFDLDLERYSDENQLTLLAIELGTGRKHQIRRHLSLEAGTSCINDLKYGFGSDPGIGNNIRQIGLHSSWIMTKIGTTERQFIVPVLHGQDSIWKNFVNLTDGHFDRKIQDQQVNFW